MSKQYSVVAESFHNLLELHNKHSKSEDDKICIFESSLILARYLYSKYKTPVINSSEKEDFIVFVAEEIYLFIIDSTNSLYGKLSFYYIYKDSIPKYLRLFVQTSDDYRETSLFDPCYSSRYTKCEDPSVILKTDVSNSILNSFNSIRKFIRSSNYIKSPVAKNNVKISFLLSIKYKHFISFRLSEKDESIARFVYNKFRQTTINNIRKASESEIIPIDKLAIISLFQYLNADDLED